MYQEPSGVRIMAYTTIDDPSAHFHTQLYTGNGSSGLAITNDANAGDFKPDLLWISPRSNGDNNVVWDSSRTINKRLKVNATAVEDSDTTALVTFETDGFDLDTTDTNFNGSSRTYVAWQWKANGGTRTTNTESGDNPAGGYQANTTAGFSIVDYTGTGAAGTMAHGLGAAPGFIVIKNREAVVDWATYHKGTGFAPVDETDAMHINNTDALTDAATFWNDTAPTSTVFTINTNNNCNTDGETYIAYCWAPIQGYSKFGGYEGNGSANGPFIYTGFKPAWTLIKCTSNSGEAWAIHDIDRSPVNPMDDVLFASNSNAESANETDRAMDFVSNGIKVRATDSGQNTDGRTYIYAAFAHQPFVTSGGVPCTAR
jgi:hypothetical protein